MTTKSLLQNIQQAILYLLTAISLVFVVYFEQIFVHKLGGRASPSFNTWQVGLLLVTASLLAAGTVISLIKPNSSAKIAIVAALIGGSYLLLRLCWLAITLFPLLFLPGSFVTLVLPTVMTYLTFAYSRQVIFTKRQNESLIHWLISKDGANYFTKGLTLLVLLATLVYWGVDFSIPKIEIEKYRMTWQDTSGSHCNHEVMLGFDEAYGYYLRACSAELLTYLQSSNDNLVEVIFERNYWLGTWEYRVKQVGKWQGQVQIEGLEWSCHSNDSKCQNLSVGLPLKQPYVLH